MKKKKQAVLLIHGIGEQRPMDTLRGFVKAVWETDKKVQDEYAKPGTWSIPDTISDSYELRCLTTSQNKNGVLTDFYEYYWAHLMEGNKISHVTAWLKRILFKTPWKLPKPLRPIWYFLFFSGLVILYLVFNNTLPEGAQITKTPSWYSTVFGLVLIPIIVAIFSDIVGDAARYLDPSPKNIKRRQEIRSKGIDLLKKMHDSGKYDRIIVVGHSLGTFIAYDILTYAWQHFNNGIDITGASTKTKLPELYKMEKLLAAWEKYKSDDLEEDEKMGLLAAWIKSNSENLKADKKKELLVAWEKYKSEILEKYKQNELLIAWEKYKLENLGDDEKKELLGSWEKYKSKNLKKYKQNELLNAWIRYKLEADEKMETLLVAWKKYKSDDLEDDEKEGLLVAWIKSTSENLEVDEKMETLLVAWKKYKSDDLEDDEKEGLLVAWIKSNSENLEKYKQNELLNDWPTIEEGIEKAETYRILKILKSWNKIKKLLKESGLDLNKIKELLDSDTSNKDLNFLKLEKLKKLLEDWEQTINAFEAEKDRTKEFLKNWGDYKKNSTTENDDTLINIYQQFKRKTSKDTKIQELDKIEILLEAWRGIIRGTFKNKRTFKMVKDTPAKRDEKIQALNRAWQSYKEGTSEDSDVQKIEKMVALFKAWQSKEKDDTVDNNPKKDEMEKLLGDKNIHTFLESIVSKKYRHLQYKVHQENKKVRQEQSKEHGNWLVSDLVTLGSPLTYSDLLLAENLEELRTKQEQRELPTVPPILDKKKITYETRVKVDDDERKLLFFHDAAMFGLTRWTNITFKPSKTIFGDIISGPLKPVLGCGVKDVETKTKILNGLVSHTNYWSPEKKKNPGKDATEEEKKNFEVDHILDLREALDLLYTNDH